MLTLSKVADGDLHSLADFSELLCLLKPDRVLSVEDLTDHLVDECGEVRGARNTGDGFAHMRWRASAFGTHYPFTMAENQQSISAPEVLNDLQKVYALLLLCASLPHVKRADIGALTDVFERLAYCALKRMWPREAEVRTFGRNNAQYTGSKSERMHKLALDLGCRPTIDSSKFRPGDTGDGGIDLAAWLDLDDYLSENKISALVQCACSRSNWSAKQYEINGGRLNRLFNPTSPWMELMCIPLCFRDNNGRWAVEGDIGDVILVDRLRLLRRLDLPNDWGEIDPPGILEEFLDTRLELV
jgi:hypothetical protein